MPRLASSFLAVTVGVVIVHPCLAGRAEVPPRIGSMVPLLDAPELAVRERAMADLLDPELGVTLEHIESLITPDLSPEQRLRLTAIARDLFRTMPRGALGIRWNANQDRNLPGLVIEEVLEGFDAHAKLRTGDRIIEMDRIQIIQPDDVRAAILSHAPGDEMELGVERDGEILEVRIRLGDQRALFQQQVPPDLSFYLDRAFQRRVARWSGPSERRTIPAALGEADWFAPNEREAGVDPAQLQIALQRLAAPALLPGGQARDSADRLGLLAEADSWNLAIEEAQFRVLNPVVNQVFDVELRQRATEMRALLEIANRRLVEIERARAGSPGEQALRALSDERAQIDALRARLASELRRLDQAMRAAQLQQQQFEP